MSCQAKPNFLLFSILLIFGSLANSQSLAARPSQNVPVKSMFYDQNSRFSDSQVQVFSLAITRILQQVGCVVDIDSQARSTQGTLTGMKKIMDSDRNEILVRAQCRNEIEVGFQTLSSELVQISQLKPDLLFLNGRLVRLGMHEGKMVYSDGEVITSGNIGQYSVGYSSHPTRQQKLDHVDSVAGVRQLMSDAGISVGTLGIVIGAPVAAVGVSIRLYNAGFMLLQRFGLLKSAIFNLWSALHYNNYVTTAGITSVAAGVFVALISLPTSAKASDLVTIHQQPEYHSQMIVSKGYGKLVQQLGSDSHKVLESYIKGTKLKDAVSEYAKSDSDKNAIVEFYNWWR